MICTLSELTRVCGDFLNVKTLEYGFMDGGSDYKEEW